ncbi:MAG: hypothetical protein Q8L37_02000 [Candidatus Gottesmanbacteria bacterium]|nr:hypothetical protein [Candidatus Gottesmanbacteria bacterium]
MESLFIETEKTKKEFSEKLKKVNKPIIYTEGNNVVYIKKAKEFFAPSLDLDIESLGCKTDIKKFFTRYSEANFERYKILFVFDCDAKDDFNACNSKKTNFLIPFIFKNNTENTEKEIQAGIENLFSSELFTDEQKNFSITETKKDGNIISRERTLRKPEFQKFICEERNEESDFKNFDALFKEMEKLFK